MPDAWNRCATGAPSPGSNSPLCDCNDLHACTGSCLEPLGIPESDFSFRSVRGAEPSGSDPPARNPSSPGRSAVSGAAGPGQSCWTASAPNGLPAGKPAAKRNGRHQSHRYARAWVRKNFRTWDPTNFHRRPGCNGVSLGRSFASSLKRLNRDTLTDATKLIFGDAFQTRPPGDTL
jgi:hypothetical protein